jgi:hypothetical protein
MRLIPLVLAWMACASAPGPVAPPSIAGSWERELPNGEHHRLTLFSSGIMAFQHGDAKLPVSRSYGRWAHARGALSLTIVASEPDGTHFPYAATLATTITASTLTLAHDGERSQWTAVRDPYGTGDGTAERAAKDERDWTYLVERTAPR